MIEKIKENWDNILLTLKNELEITNISYTTWLEPLKPYSFHNNKVTIIVPEQTFLSYVERKYGPVLMVIISEFLGLDCEVEFKVIQQIQEEEMSSGSAGGSRLIQKNTASISPDMIQSANLNAKYTFDTFVVGSNNNLAHAAALAVAESPGEIYNPLFIYGGVGLGKTHLMHAIAHFILKNNPKSKILYVSSETFTNELIDAIRNKNNITTTEFREKYRNNDVLLIDDIQFIIGKESTQEEFFHTFNTLYESKKQIIISSDKPPKEIETLEERLRSRFEWGLTVDIQSPDYETRMAILRKKEEMEGYNIDNEVIKYIATNIKSNIRELEGALTKIVALSRLNKCDITLELAEEALKDIISPNAHREITPELIIQVVSDHFGLTPLDIASQKRNKEVVYPRQIVMYLCRNMMAIPLQTVGKYLGGRDHTTIIHGSEKIANDLKNNESLVNTIDILKKKINPQ
ncbi:MAG: chromosomal replication initiator protein DnaA [Clostridium sp.]|nr:chromosomal replication initiator protein DnaA [Clostridium sp.]